MWKTNQTFSWLIPFLVLSHLQNVYSNDKPQLLDTSRSVSSSDNVQDKRRFVDDDPVSVPQIYTRLQALNFNGSTPSIFKHKSKTTNTSIIIDESKVRKEYQDEETIEELKSNLSVSNNDRIASNRFLSDKSQYNESGSIAKGDGANKDLKGSVIDFHQYQKINSNLENNTTLKEKNVDSISSPISNKPLHEDSMSSPISNKQLDEDSMSSPISNKPLHEDSMSSSISNKQLDEDSMSSPISNKPLHEDSISSPISNKPLDEDSMSSPISNKPLHEDSVSSSISNKPLHEVSKSSSISNKQLDEDSMSSPISNKQLDEDSISSPISNKPLHEDSMSSSISNKQLDEDSMSSPISNKPLHEDSISSPISNKPLDEDSMSSPISNKPLHEDSVSSSISNKPLHEVSKSSSISNKQLDEDSMSSSISNKPLHEVSISSSISNKPLDEDSTSSPISNKPLHEDFDRRDYVDISSRIPDFLAKSSDSVREKDKLNTFLKRGEKISSFHQSSHSTFKASSFSDKNFANISNNMLYSSTTPISVFPYLKHNVTTILKGLQGLVLQNASIETTITDEPEFLHDSDTSFTRHFPIELSSLYNTVTHFGTNITNITGKLISQYNSNKYLERNMAKFPQEPIPQHNSTKYLERNMAKFPQEPIPQDNSTTHYFANIPQTSKYDPTLNFSSDVAHVLRDSQYNFTAYLGRYVHQQPIPQYHSTSNVDGKDISDIFGTLVPHRTTITPFVEDVYNDSSQLVLKFNSTDNHRENVSVLPAKPTQLPSAIRHTDGSISNLSYRIEQQNNSEKYLGETALCVSGKSIQKENFTKRCTLNVSKSHEGSLSKYNSSSYIEVNNSSNWYEHLLKYKIKWSPLFKSSTKMSNLSFSYPVEINTTQTFNSKPGFNNSSEEDVLKLKSTKVTFENKIDSTNETRTIPDENTEKPVNHTKLGTLNLNQKPISWYKDNGHRLNFSEKNKSHFLTDMFVADSQLPESSFSSVNSTTQADPKKPSNSVVNFKNVRQSSNPSIVTTVQTTKNQQRDNTGINSAFDSQLDDSLWNGRSSTNFSFDHQEETVTTINMNSVKDEQEYFLRNLPEWEKSQNQWGLSWKLHIYITGSLFGLLALYCFISFLKLGTSEKLFSRGCVISINLMVFVMGITRALYLLFNPYNTQGLYPTVLNNFVFNTGFLCVTSGFAILFLALLQTTKVVILPHCVQNSRFLSGIIILQFIFSTATDVLQGFGLSGALLRLIYHTTQSLWGLTLGVGYLHVFRKLYKSAVRKQSDLVRTAFTRLHIDGAQLPKKLPKPTLCLAVRSTIMVVVFCLVMVALRVFGIIYIYGIFERKKPTPWIWFGYQTVSRLVELLMCFALTFIATLPMKRFELNEQRCSNFLLCSAVIRSSCSRHEEVESENIPIFLPNHQGNPNVAFHKTSLERPRRWNHTTSLPTIPTFSIELENNFHMKKVSTNTDTVEEKSNPSVPNLLSSGHSNHPSNTNDCSDESQKPTNFEDKLLDGSSTSMLYIDQGFIRFRTAGDPEQPLHLNEDELSEVLSYHDENESTKAQAGSSIQTLCEEDLFQNSLSPFFQTGFYLSRLKRLSHWSLDTTDNSVELSPEQLSNVTSKNGFSSCALDFTLRKQGSTCSSESAANSFDVTFFLNREANEDKTSNVHIRDTMTRSVSPFAASTRRNHDFQLDLDLTSGSGVGQVNVACGTEDITPDSAVYLDIQVSQENYCKKTDVFLVDNLARKSLCSQSMTDINKTWTEYSRGFFGQLKSSTFSLDTNFNGCELLETKQESQLRRTNSDKGPLLTDSRTFFPLAANLNKSPFVDSKQLHQGDSGFLKDSPEYLIQIDQACQTEPVFTEEKFTKTSRDSSKGASRWPLFSYREVIV